MDLKQNAVWRYECLARLMTLDQHAYLPAEFLYLVERHDLVSELTQTIFNRSASYFRDINMAWNINLSFSDLSDKAIHQFLRSQLAHYPNPQRIAVEVTAQNVLKAPSQFKEFVSLCQSLNISIVVDHFEQSVEDLQAILSLPIAAIKVPASLFEQAKLQSAQAELVEHIMSLSKANKIAVIAERIEQQSTLEAVKQYGVNYAQGFYFSQPKASAA
jgi:EAL domain-containing protein (putative c-di-GMP-specific phosphodiesterase class I)